MRPVYLRMTGFGPYSGVQELDFRELGKSGFFLIHGPTGSGKTSILDGICFALYGRCSGEDRPPDSVRCQYADQSTPTEVVLEFELGGELYRSTRSPQYERPKQRGEGTTTQQATAFLENVTHLKVNSGSTGKVLAARVREADTEICSLLGFSIDQFRQVMVLPQGEFRRLLYTPSNERTKILETLFRTHVYSRMQDALDKEAKKLEEQRRSVVEKIRLLLEQADVGTEEELSEKQGELEKEIKQAHAAFEVTSEKEKQKRKALETGRALEERFREAEAAKAHFDSLNAEKERIDTVKTRLTIARKAKELKPLDDLRQTRVTELESTIEALAEAESAVKSASVAQSKAKKELEKEASRQQEREDALKTQHELESQREHVEKLQHYIQGHDRLSKDHAAAREKLSDLLTEQKEDETSYANDREELECLGPIAAKADSLLAEKKRIENTAAIRARIDKEETQYRQLIDSNKKTITQLSEAEKAFANQKAVLERMRDEWHQGQAAVLARDLESDKPCPVCGSAHHPHPARQEVEPPSDDDLERAESDLQSLEKKRKDIQEKANRSERDLASRKAILDELKTQAGDASGKDVTTLNEELSLASKRHEESTAAQRRVLQIKETVEKLEKSIRRRSEVIKAREKAAAELDTKKQVAAASMQNARRSISEDVETITDLEKRIAAAEKLRRILEESLKSAQKQAQHAEKELARLEASLEAAKKNHQTAEKAAASTRTEFNKALAEAGFQNRAEFNKAAEDIPRIDALADDVDTYQKSIHASQERLKAAQAQVKDEPRPDLDQLTEDFAVAEKEKDNAAARLQNLTADLGRMKKTVEQISAANQKDAGLREEYEAVSLLAGVANGRREQNPSLMKFQQYVLAALLDDVLVLASQRLSILSKSRYRLRRVTDPTTGRRSTALDLEVEDSFTGYSRPVQSLSGGESFLASLSLALGLADVVQSYAGGMELGTLFIDEGFGTLDDQSLDQAIRILLDLQKGNKLVGIISHVRELRDCIDVRLEVAPGPRGSTARFCLP